MKKYHSWQKSHLCCFLSGNRSSYFCTACSGFGADTSQETRRFAAAPHQVIPRLTHSLFINCKWQFQLPIITQAGLLTWEENITFITVRPLGHHRGELWTNKNMMITWVARVRPQLVWLSCVSRRTISVNRKRKPTLGRHSGYIFLWILLAVSPYHMCHQNRVKTSDELLKAENSEEGATF